MILTLKSRFLLPGTFVLSDPTILRSYCETEGDCVLRTVKLGLSHFNRIRSFLNRNSYRYRKYHIYETVKLNQIKLSNQFNYSESEKRFKAFIDNDLAWALIATQHIFYDNRLLRDKRSSSTWDPHWGKSGLLYDCVWSVSVSQPWANPASTLDESPWTK